MPGRRTRDRKPEGSGLKRLAILYNLRLIVLIKFWQLNLGG